MTLPNTMDRVEAQVEFPSILDTIETTAYAPLPASYQDFRARRYAEEFQAALNLYCHIDGIEGTERAEQLLQCRQYAWFARHVITGKVKVVSNACRLRWCPICAAAKASMFRGGVCDWLKLVKNAKFMTLTVQHTNEPLKVQVERLYKQFRLFRQHKALKKVVRGGVWFFQLTYRPKSHQWHPHLHCVLDSNYISKRLLSLEWLATTGTSFIVDIRAVKDPRRVADYVARYSSRPCKLSEFESGDQTEIFSFFHGRRLCGGFGTGRGVLDRPDNFEDRINWQRLPSWSVVISNQRDGGALQAVLRAWLTDKPVELSEVESVIRPFGPDTALSFKRLTVVENKQFVFEAFR